MINLFAIPDKEKDFQSYMLYVLTIIWSAITAIAILLAFYYFPHLETRWITYIITTILIVVFNLYMTKLGYIRFASWSVTIMLWLYITIPCYSAGGISAPGILSQTSIIVTAGFLLGWRGGVAIGLLTLATDFGFTYLEIIGQLPAPTVQHNPLTRWIATTIPFGTIIILQYYATKHLRTSLYALQREISKREEAEKIKDQTVHNLGERLKELKTLYEVNRILQHENISSDKQFSEIVEVLCSGWQYSDITAARIFIAEKEYSTSNFRNSNYCQRAEMKTSKGTKVSIEIVYLQAMPESDEGPFLNEERNLINMLVEMLKINTERTERMAELKDYKYALDIAASVSITEKNGTYNYVNNNFCKINNYTSEELLGQKYDIIWSDYKSHAVLKKQIQEVLEKGKPYIGEFCNKTKDGKIYWADTTIVPFLDENKNVYQYLTITHDITERKEAEEKIKESQQLVKKITSQIPGNTYLFEIEENGTFKIIFSNRGTEAYNHPFETDNLIKNPNVILEILHDDDKEKFINTFKEAYYSQSIISLQYRIIINGQVRWRWLQASPEKDRKGQIVWYGATSDITPLIEYIASIEQIIFDIGHVIRRPIASMMGMTRLIVETDLGKKKTKKVSQKLYTISEEMDKFIMELNIAYNQKRQNTEFNIDFTSLVDKRISLFKK